MTEQHHPVCYVYAHGWGVDSTLWQEMAPWPHAHGTRALFYERGYFGMPSPDVRSVIKACAETHKVVAVGHSFGLCRLLRLSKTWWHGVVSISGMLCLPSKDDNPCGVRPSLLTASLSRLRASPMAMLRDFYAYCGVEGRALPSHEESVMPLLEEDFKDIQTADERMAWQQLLARGVPCLCLWADDDKVVPSSLSQAHMTGDGVLCHRWHDGGHMLPFTKPLECRQHIQTFMRTMVI
ncbi:MAG: alpha/beta hydrolase [Alphaproteobacteria bacterium GM7ARS4]|nr:alpha/beta hydrolase [Alphaproteobacteria bacterium GM7ARS4]